VASIAQVTHAVKLQQQQTAYSSCVPELALYWLLEAHLVQGDRGWPAPYRRYRVRRVADGINSFFELLFGPVRE
jgi:hypothetical protein